MQDEQQKNAFLVSFSCASRNAPQRIHLCHVCPQQTKGKRFKVSYRVSPHLLEKSMQLEFILLTKPTKPNFTEGTSQAKARTLTMPLRTSSGSLLLASGSDFIRKIWEHVY